MMKHRFFARLMVFIAVFMIVRILLSFYFSYQKGFNDPVFYTVLIAIVCIMAIGILLKMYNGQNKAQQRQGKKVYDGNDKSSLSGNYLVSNEVYDRMYQQYMTVARQFEKNGQYKEAANVYIKLLKNYYMGAEALRKGKYFNEAGALFESKLKNLQAAAECYEEGNNYSKAIALHKEMGHNEKVGDLYAAINDKQSAHQYYQLVIDDYLQQERYLKASIIYKAKMDAVPAAQEILMKGWNQNKDAFNCLNNYFHNITDEQVLLEEINRIMQHTTGERQVPLLNALRLEYKKHSALRNEIREMGYRIIAQNINKNKSMAEDLCFFNPDDKLVLRDVMQYRLKK